MTTASIDGILQWYDNCLSIAPVSLGSVGGGGGGVLVFPVFINCSGRWWHHAVARNLLLLDTAF